MGLQEVRLANASNAARLGLEINVHAGISAG